MAAQVLREAQFTLALLPCWRIRLRVNRGGMPGQRSRQDKPEAAQCRQPSHGRYTTATAAEAESRASSTFGPRQVACSCSR